MTRVLRCAGLALLLVATSACSSGGSTAPAPDAEPQLQPGATLLGSVGTPQDPESFEITLTAEDGTPVEVLAAGSYTLVVNDLARIHNFHLTGPGVDVGTDVAGTGEETFAVTFESGQYDYVCDPHPSMSGALRAV